MRELEVGKVYRADKLCTKDVFLTVPPQLHGAPLRSPELRAVLNGRPGYVTRTDSERVTLIYYKIVHPKYGREDVWTGTGLDDEVIYCGHGVNSDEDVKRLVAKASLPILEAEITRLAELQETLRILKTKAESL